MDLFACAGYSSVSLAALILARAGTPVAALFVVFTPGYVVLASLFPRKDDLSWSERLAFSFALSIAIVAVLGWLLDFTPFGIRLASIVISIWLFTIGMAGVAYWRRGVVASPDRLVLDLDVRRPAWGDYPLGEKAIVVGLIAGVVLASVALVYIVVSPAPGGHSTELYLLGPGGNASGYPTDLNVSQKGTSILGIVNHESATLNYGLRIDLEGVGFVYNASTGHNETVEVNRTTLSWFNVTLADGASWIHVYTFSISYVGLWKLHFFLYKNGVLTSQELHLYVRVT